MIRIPEEINLENYILILPSVAVGNVGQLCLDLLIYNLNLEKIGSMWNSVFLPIVGLDPYNETSRSLCTTADFYLGSSSKIICLQLRSPCVGHSNDFSTELVTFIKKTKISKVIILTSSYAYECLSGTDPTIRYLSSDASLLNNEEFLQKNVLKKHKNQTSEDSTEKTCISGGGFASNLYELFISKEIPCTVLYCYCSEGNNVSDALLLFDALNQWLVLLPGSKTSGIKYPPSWEYFFGNPPSSELY